MNPRVSETSTPDGRERTIASMGPLLSVAGALVTPVASTLAPFVLFLFVRNRGLPFARLHALRAADFAFSIYLWLLILGFGLAGLAGLFPQLQALGSQASHLAVARGLVLGYLLLMVIGLVQALRGRPIRYVLSFRLAERVFLILERRAGAGEGPRG